METDTNYSNEAQITLRKALIILLGVVAVVVAIGLTVGYVFFWNQFDHRTAADLRLQAIEKYTAKNAKNPVAHASLGLEYLRRSKTKEAIAELEKAYKLDSKNIGIKFSLGLAYSEVKEYDKARPLLEAVVQQNPVHFLGQVNLGLLYYNTKQYDKALKCFNQALTVNNGAADVLVLRANTYAALGKKDLALQDIDKALRYVPGYKDALDAKAKISGK